MEPGQHTAIARTIKGLAIDAIEAARSGHPGLPLGMADVATVLWTRFLRHDPTDPSWPNRDRFVLSAGHGSMLLYALLHLTGYDLPLSELKRFRQLESRTPGHPEVGHTPGVETTTGPLGQGFANGVGMALAERYLAATLSSDGAPAPLDHRVYAIVSDGDLMEGVSQEAASLAGHLGLSKLCCLYDDNQITIDGPTGLAFSEDVEARFLANGWHTVRVDGHDPEAIAGAISEARSEERRPSLILCRTIIGHGSPSFEGTSDIHSDPVGPEEVRRIKERVGLPPNETFHVSDEVRAFFEKDRTRLGAERAAWDERFAGWAAAHPEAAATWERLFARRLPEGLAAALPTFASGEKAATRGASGQVIQALAAMLPELVGGSADLTPSNKTKIKGGGWQSREVPTGRNVHFGVREHAMGAILNGMVLHGACRPFGGTFLTFSDYMRPSIRLAALMRIPTTFVFTHDSIFVGEDGPTHQPVEQIASLRAIPNLHVDRPADGRETAAAWLAALGREDGPAAFALTRQKVPHLEGTSVEGALRGGYVVRDCDGPPALLLVGTGSELQLCLEAADTLGAEGVACRVVSLPCWERFDAQDAAYREAVLPDACAARVACEAGVPQGWARYVGRHGEVVAQRTFGASAPYAALVEHFGYTPSRVVEAARRVLAAASPPRAAAAPRP